MSHTHKAKFTIQVGNGIAYEVCECGASRRTEHEKGMWHTCALCTRLSDEARFCTCGSVGGPDISTCADCGKPLPSDMR